MSSKPCFCWLTVLLLRYIVATPTQHVVSLTCIRVHAFAVPCHLQLLRSSIQC